MTTTTPSLRRMSNRSSIMQRRLKQQQQHRTPHRGGDEEVTADNMYSESNNDDDNPNNNNAAAILNCNTSYESRDSTITSQSGDDSSEITERANNMASSRMMKTAGIEGVAATAADVISACTYEEDDEDDEVVVNCGVDEEEHDEEEIEVRKEDGGTELYNLIEKALWDEVCERIEEYPKEAKIWVTSSGKDDTLFSWDVWRRLPLHEACRRQPPPVVIYSLLSAYPQSSHIASNFGELPLHGAVRCGACAEVVNCILAAYPTAVFERDNSGCTPMDILNGTGRIMDHDSVIAALNRTMKFVTKEEQVFQWKMSQLESKLKDETDEQCAKYEDIIYKKDEEIAELKRQLQQEKLATNNLASKVIQSEKIVQQKVATEKSHLDILEKMEGELLDLNAANSSRKTKITELEDVIESDRKTIIDLTEVIETLRGQLTTICEEEERFVADNLVKAEANLKAMFEHQYVFLKETEKRKELMRERLSTLGISLSASLSEDDDEEEDVEEEGEEECVEEETEEESVDEPSDYEVARVALASAMHAVQPFIQHSEEESLVEGVLGTFSREE